MCGWAVEIVLVAAAAVWWTSILLDVAPGVRTWPRRAWRAVSGLPRRGVALSGVTIETMTADELIAWICAEEDDDAV